jgi:hypothetical protein
VVRVLQAGVLEGSLFHPITLRILATAGTYAIKNLPAAYLARFGLVRAVPVLAPVPLIGATASGALIAALAIPQSRNWLKEQTSSAYESVRGTLHGGKQPR